MKKIVLLLVVATAFTFCKKETTTPVDDGPTKVAFEVPVGFPIVDIPADNPLTVEGIELGRMLYYDSLMHPTNDAACASCHLQAEGFASVAANALPHVNLAWSRYFLWNGKLDGTLEEAMLFEVDEFFKTDLNKLQNDPDYPAMYKAAFGASTITSENTAKALSQFLRTVNSSNSDYDKFFRGEMELTESQYRGYLLFNSEDGDCFHCHALPLLADNQFHDTGLDSIYDVNSMGRYDVTGLSTDRGKFKTPTLRNIEFTFPYMHDGRFNTLMEVVEFYNSGTKHSPNLDPIMTKPGKELGLELTLQEKQDLVNFMKSFTDYDLLGDPELSDPHVN